MRTLDSNSGEWLRVVGFSRGSWGVAIVALGVPTIVRI
jgi:hypothetical protein